MKIVTSDIKKGTILEIDGQLYKVLDFSFMQMQQRQGSYTYKMRNIISGGVQNMTYKSGTVLELAEVATKNAVYLYNSGDVYSFMENDSGEMFDLNKDMVEDIIGYLKENMDCFLTIYKGNVIGVILPTTISYKIISTVPGVKGDRAQAGKKPATLETGMEIMIPLHKNEGDMVTVNTLTGETN
ncbi:MAG: elongation factor P [Candidatus Absconditabacterales bacterium]